MPEIIEIDLYQKILIIKKNEENDKRLRFIEQVDVVRRWKKLKKTEFNL